MTAQDLRGCVLLGFLNAVLVSSSDCDAPDAFLRLGLLWHRVFLLISDGV